jgi:hypothetical protein
MHTDHKLYTSLSLLLILLYEKRSVCPIWQSRFRPSSALSSTLPRNCPRAHDAYPHLCPIAPRVNSPQGRSARPKRKLPRVNAPSGKPRSGSPLPRRSLPQSHTLWISALHPVRYQPAPPIFTSTWPPPPAPRDPRFEPSPQWSAYRDSATVAAGAPRPALWAFAMASCSPCGGIPP